MGHIGQLSRGLKWWKSNRDLDGVLKQVISDDYNKMLDVNYFLDYVDGKDRDAVELALYQVFLLRQAEGGTNSKLFRDLVQKIRDGNFTNSKEKVKVKEKK